jgi:hypothetical protein
LGDAPRERLKEAGASLIFDDMTQLPQIIARRRRQNQDG